MSQAGDEAVTRESRKQIAELEALGWYHSIELPDGTVTQGHQGIEHLRKRLAQFPIPGDLHGKRVLDIGAWDGWFSFEMERRGAEVVALDLVTQARFLLAHRLLKSSVEYRAGDICRIEPKDLGHFDIVLFLGVLYHVRHPLLALEKVCALTDDLACVESYVTDNGEDPSAPPILEFYETTELRGQFDNWVGPNTPCLLAMARAAGFAAVKLETVLEQRAHVTCNRKAQAKFGMGPAPLLLCVENTVSHDHSFSAAGDDYVSLWFRCEEPGICCDNVYVEIGPYGARPVTVVSSGRDGRLAVCKLPPGLKPLWHAVRLRVAGSLPSNAVRVPVDLSIEERRKRLLAPPSPDLHIISVTDGRTWEPWKVRAGPGSCLSVWIRGIPDAAQVCVLLEDVDLPAIFVSEDREGWKQVNSMIPQGIRPGKACVRLECAGKVSAPVEIELIEKAA